MVSTYLMVLWGTSDLFDAHSNPQKWLFRGLMAVLIWIICFPVFAVLVLAFHVEMRWPL